MNQFPSNSKCKLRTSSSATDKIKAVKDKYNESVENKIKQEPKVIQDKPSTIGEKYIGLMNKLGFEPDKQRKFRKRYAIDGGGIVVVYPNMEPSMSGGDSKLEWFSVVTQRAVGINEDFRRFMPPDAASDCELMASELGEQVITRPEVGTIKCDNCGAITDEFGVDPRKDRVLCINPNGCFRKSFGNAGAQAEL
jgi:hypothetical protein